VEGSAGIRKVMRLWQCVSKSASMANGLVIRSNTLATQISKNKQPNFICMWCTWNVWITSRKWKKYVHYLVPLWVAARVKDNPNELLSTSTPLIQRHARVNTESEAAPWSLRVIANNKE
jgi:hypothetical protein